MQFHVPQFIEVESKIFGPLTFKQFAYLLGGVGLIFIFYSLLPFWLVVILGAPAAGLSISLAFLQIHGRPFIQVVESAIRHFSGNKLYIWRKPSATAKQKKEIARTSVPSAVPRLTESKLQDLAWSLDVKEKVK